MASRRELSLSDAQRAGQFLFVGIDGTEMSQGLRRQLTAVCPSGIVLFARNLVEAPQIATFCRDLAEALPVVPFIAIDQEGGRVNRLKGIFPPIPANLLLSRASTPGDLVREHARQTGRGLSLLGFNVNFAPVLDLSDDPAPNGIGDRAYGTDPVVVTQLAGLFLTTLEGEGILGCGKHFPGLGGGRVDSHQDLPKIDRQAEDLWRQDLAPYRELRKLCSMVMVGHAYYPALQEGAPHPASLSRAVVTDLLRRRVGYEGISLTDDLEMGAVDQRRAAGDITLRALDAGNDLLMFCKDWDRIEEAHATLVRSFRSGLVPSARIDASLSRTLSLKQRLPEPRTLPPFDRKSLEEVCRAFGHLEERARG